MGYSSDVVANAEDAGLTPRARDECVWAIVCTFNPSASLLENVIAVAPQVDGIIVVDDGSTSDTAALYQEAARYATIVHQDSNNGIAASINTGVNLAERRGATHVLTLDQDSCLDEGYVTTALRGLRRIHSKDPRALAAGAGLIKAHGTIPENRPHHDLLVRETLQSGLVIDLTMIRMSGVFREDFFIDCVDVEFILRAAANGFNTYVIYDCVLHHGLGEVIETGWIGRHESVAYHPPFRWYYIARNRLRVTFKYGRAYPNWAAHSFYDELRRLMLNLIYGRDRRRIVLAVLMGAADCARSRNGKIRDTTFARLQPSGGSS